MKTKLVLTLAVAGVAWAIASQTTPHLAVGATAPDFKGVASDGKEYALKTLTGDSPAFLVFWKERCPHNPKATALFNALHKAYGEKVKLIGFVNASEERTKGWASRFQLSYPLLADGAMSTIKGYGLRYSICAFQVGKDGKIEKVFPGYGKESVEGLNAAMAAASGIDAKVDLSSAPSDLTWG